MLRRLLVALALGSVLLSACGGNGGTTGAGAGTTGGATATGSTGGAGATGTATGTTGGATGSTGGAGSIGNSQCAELVAAMTDVAGANPGVATGSVEDLQRSLDQLEAFADAAPEEIRADVQTVTDVYAQMVQAFIDSGYDPTSNQPPPPELVAKMGELSKEFDSQDFQAAAERVTKWFDQGCGA